MQYKLLIILSIFSGVFLASSCRKSEKSAKNAEEVIYNEDAVAFPVDIENSKLFWIGRKVTGMHNGTVGIKSGEILVKNDTVTGGKFEIDMSTIVDLDLTDEKMNKKLTGHLKSPDFFNVDSFPIAVFEITSAEKIANPTDSNNYKISGNLTIKGIVSNISFPAKIVATDGMVNAKATIVIDRTVYNIRYNSGKFFKNLGDKLINDEFEVSVDILAKKPSEEALSN